MPEPTREPAVLHLPPGIRLRAATDADLPELIVLVRECIEEMRSHGIDQWDEVYPNGATLSADVRTGTLHVALDESDRLAGCLVLNEFQDPEYSHVPWRETATPIAVVHRLMVRPAAQGRGLATALMRFAESRAATLGYRAIRLDAFTHNPAALRLYNRLGYRDAGSVRLRKGTFRCFEKPLPA